jgi:hypothetical protein
MEDAAVAKPYMEYPALFISLAIRYQRESLCSKQFFALPSK